MGANESASPISEASVAGAQREMYYVHRNTWTAQELHGISKIP